MKLTTSKANPSIGVLLTAEYVREEVDVSVEAGQANNLVVSSDVTFNAPASICRYLVRAAPAKALYGANDLERSEDMMMRCLILMNNITIDHWLEFSYGRLSCTSEFDDALLFLDHVLGPVTFLVNHCVTLADIAVWGTLRGSPTWHQLVVSGEAPKNVVRYYSFLAAQEKFSAVEKTLPQVKVQPKQPVQKERKEEGKFIDLPGAKIGEVVVRFPPEASGYLHVGHAKAALLNQYYQLTFEGKLVMRFDDTNPAKESSEFEQVILEDLKMLGVKPDIFTHTSDSFDLIMGFCEKLMAEGKVYCDDTAPEQMKLEREERAESACRSNTVERNFEMWEEMKAGTAAGKTYCVRAKIDMKSDNGCMRDPTVYRCKDEPHVRTGTKYKVYPTYDFACPIVDSVEGVTHALRTTEYHDRDVQFYWFIEQMGLRKPYIWEYSRLNLQNTIMSKRKLTWFVNEGIVDGWDDPRFPTVRGVLRHGMTVEGLKQFVIAQGSSRSVVMMDWEKIWAFNKKVIDPISPRYTALVQHDVIRVIISGVSEEKKQVQKHPKDPALGMKDVWYGPSVMIEAADAADFTEGQNVTFINWGNLIIKKINRSDGKVTSIEAEQNLSNTDYKKTHKVTWLTVTDSAPLVPTACVHYDNIITKAVLAKEDNFKDYVNRDTKTVTEMLGDPMLATLKKGDIIQLQRKGFFICDSAFEEISGRHSPVVLFAIPDGHVKDVHQAGSKHKGAQQEKADVPSAKEKAQSKKGKAAEKSPQDEKPPSLPVANNDATAIDTKITAQGVKVRELKAAKAPKDEVQAAVKVLLDLKAEYKKATGQDWKPSTIPAPAISLTATSPVGDSDAAGLDAKISAQGSKVREIKAAKAPKDEVQAAVKVLLDLKAEYKKVTGQDWKPGTNPAPAVAPAAAPAEEASDAAGLDVKIATQGNKVREIKAAKASKEEVQAAVKVLLDLKAKYKKMVGKDWKPSATHAPDAAPVAASVVRDSDAAGLDAKISAQGNTVREIKAAKAPKDEVQVAVKILLDLKAEYKKMTGHDWKPSTTPVPATALTAAVATDLDAACLDAKISAQGSKVREIKATKAPKDEVQAAVKVLLDLKAEYKNATGLDWKPSTTPAPTAARAAAPATLACGDAAGLGDRVTAQGNKVRELKSSKAPKDEVQAAVKELLDLKAEYKKVTGQDWKPGAAPAPAEASAPVVEAVASGDLSEADELQEKIDAQGGTVRDLKGKKAPKEEIDAAVKALLGLKAEYKTLAGEDPAPSAGGGGRQKKDKKEKANKENQPKKEQKEQPQSKPKKEQPQTKDCGDGAAREVKKMTRLGLEAKKEENLPDWYSQVITKSEMIEYYDVSGCYVLRPWSFSIWERIQAWFDAKIKEMGFQNVYFPIFVSNAALQKEKEHIEDFAPEVAWVTRSGESELAEPIAIRPTSETVMYPAYARWIQSHRDLPIKLNQWCNVVRWEFKHPQPFLRTREFLWQEGHSAYATYKEAEEEVYAILGLYEEIYEQHMAIPVVKGRKTQKEKFAGGDFTTTVEVFISATGRGIQAATSHHLGQNFSKMFDLSFEDPASGDRHFAYQNSWAITTRSIGIIVMVHGDNKGLVLPPRMACIQIIVVPCGITTNLSEEDRKAVEAKCEEVVRTLKAAGVRTQGDYRDNYSPGWKFNHWELKGVPVRVELGPRDMKQGTLVAVRRDTGEKTTLKSEDATTALLDMLNTMHDDMFAKVKKERDEHMTQVESMNDFCTALDKKCMVLAPFCGEIPCEEQIKVVSARDAVVEEGAPAMGAKGLCIPFVQPAEITPEMKCICPDCPNPPKNYTLFGRSY